MTNFLVIVTDDYGWPHYGITRSDGRTMPELYRRRTGSHDGPGQLIAPGRSLPPPITPGFDALASRGTVFTKAWSACSVCIPSRWSQATGLMPYQFTSSGMESRTFPALLGERYKRFGGGKLRIPADDEQWGEGGWWPGSQKGSKVIREGLGAFFEFLDERKADRRDWLAYLGPTLPHKGFISDETYRRALEGYRDENGKQLYLVDGKNPYDQGPYVGLPRSLRGYYNNISLLDAGILEIVRRLNADDAWDDTIVVCHSDNGPEKDVLDTAKFSFTDRGARTLFFLAGKRTPCGTVRDDVLVHTTDVFATVCDHAGIALDGLKPTDGFYGRSLRPWIEGVAAPAWRNLVLHQDSNNRNTPKKPEQRAVTHRTGLRLEIPGKGKPGLYDLETDAAQGHNLALSAGKDLEARINEARALLEKWPGDMKGSRADFENDLDRVMTTIAGLLKLEAGGARQAVEAPRATPERPGVRP